MKNNFCKSLADRIIETESGYDAGQQLFVVKQKMWLASIMFPTILVLQIYF